MVNFNDTINVYGPGSADFGPLGQNGKPIPPPPSPSVSAYLNPSQMSNYLSGPMSDWLEENRTCFSPEDFSSAQETLSESASSLSSGAASTSDSISSFNHILSSLGFPLSNEQKADQMDAAAQSIDSQVRKSFASLEDSMTSTSSQLEDLQQQLDNLEPSSLDPSSLKSANDALSRTQGLLANVKDTLIPVDDIVGDISESAHQVSNLASQMHSFASPSTMQSLQENYSSVLKGQTSFASAFSEVTANATQQLQHIQSIISADIKPVVEPAPAYSWEDYDNNWGGGPIPGGVNGDLAFAVVNSDGSFNPQYPLGGTGDNGFAVGGWTDSQQGGGLNAVLTQALINGNLTPAQQTLLNNIVNAVEKYGYQRVVMDFEDYGDPNAGQTSASYTLFLQELGSKLHSMTPPVKLEMAISPEVSNQNYYNMNALLSGGTVDAFQVMCYDYEQGNSGTTGIASVAMTQAYLQQMFAAYPDLTQSKLMIGFPLYGAQYNLPAGLTPAQVLAALAGQNSPASGEVGDNTILSQIGNWTNPQNGWEQISNGATPPTYYYYNSTTGVLYNTFPPASMQDFANMIKTNFPNVQGFFGWEASDDLPGGSLFQTMMSYLQSPPPEVTAATSEVMSWLQNLQGVPASWVESLENELTTNPPTTLQQLASWFNTTFDSTSGNEDIYMQYPGLIQIIGGAGGRLDNQLNDLFTNNPNLEGLLNMGASIPTATPADMLFVNLQSWNPDPSTDPTGAAAKTAILKQLATYGSAWSQADIKQYYWYPLQPTLDPADAAFLAQIMYANSSTK